MCLRAGELPPVLFVGDHFGYPGGVWHGATSYFLHVLPALAARGVRIHSCFMRAPHPAARALVEQGLAPVFFSAGRLDPRVIWRLRRLVLDHGCGILHAASFQATLAARAVARLTGARLLVHVHDLQQPPGLARWLHRQIADGSELGVCVAGAAREVAVEGYALRAERVRVVHNGIELEPFARVATDARALRARLGIAPESAVLLAVGRLYPEKGHALLVEALPRLLAARPDLVLLVAGEGPERARCEAAAARLQLGDRLRLLGQRSDVPELLQAADLLVMPSRSEGLPIAAIEALAAGTPVVGFDVGGMREVVDDGRSGRVVPAGDSRALVAAILELLADPAQLAACGQLARGAAQRFSLAHHVRGLLECYAELAPGRRPAAA